jgi:hypothetical protein
MKILQRQESKYLLQLLLLVLVLGYWIFISYSKAPDLRIESISSRAGAVASLRFPASVTTPQSSTLTIEMDCDSLVAKPVKISQRKIRFTGSCNSINKDFNNSSFSIVNSTNGYTASLFVAKNKFITDFIDLTAGQNEIQISRKNHDGTTSIQSIQLNSEFE